MHIDFAPPSNGTYNNSGSCRQLANYMEHEDLERMEKGIYTEGFFNLVEDNIYKSKVIKDIDINIGQLLKTDAKFYAIHVSPSEKELQAMGNTEQEQAEAMKRYIREVFIPKYAKNFNKELSASNIKFYGKIHFDRGRSDNELNMHCHLIVSRKDQANKKKLSPLTNHKNTKSGIIKGGFDRVNLFQQIEQGFDKLFNYNRQPTESFDYRNTMKNGTIFENLNLQRQELQSSERKIEITQDSNQENSFSINLENEVVNNKKNSQTLTSLLSLVSSKADYTANFEEQIPKAKKKKKLRR
ncbi:clindamycin resistance transfer factor BtgB [Bacteroides thetaiotaomicron]|jgi:clindamycin resistance transfer factor btgB|uniref:Clindamycin resistance transfer factor BtgB n=1 Tax=Bacteroides thetaiotaomicron TaxID=818 RepID=A0A7J5JK48_BACT4|nr:clindamycin resistance transfer factor BtgB [Bacteroides thetaiotaomicron]